MDKYKELNDTYDLVKEILTDQEDTRNSIWSLYYAVCKVVNPHCMNAKFGTVLQSHEAYGLPPFETVTRVRRRVVKENPELKGTEEVEGGRWSFVEVFKRFANE